MSAKMSTDMIKNSNHITNLSTSDYKNKSVTLESNLINNHQDKDVTRIALKKEEVYEAVQKINDTLKKSKIRCEYTYHEDINRVSVKIIEDGTDKVIKELPPESTIEMVKELWKQAGIIVNELR